MRLAASRRVALPWGAADGATFGDDRWLDSAEDFSEVFVAWVRDGDYEIASTAVAGQPSGDDLFVFCRLLTLETLTC